MAVPPTTAAFWLAAMSVAAGCAGGPSLPRAVAIAEGRRTTVQLLQFGSGGEGRIFTLQNASSGLAHEVYSDSRGDPLTKVVDDAQLQALVDVFAEKGLFEGAGPSVPAEARAAIVVAQDERRWALHGAWPAAARKVAFSEAQAYFLTVYNSATAYHTADIHRADLEAERQKHDATGERKR